MKFLSMILIMSLAVGVASATAQEPKHPWAEKSSSRIHPLGLAPAPKPKTKKDCLEYLSCEYTAVSQAAFSDGELWQANVDCSLCSGKTYSGRLSEILEKYEIVQFQQSQNVFRFLLKRK